MMVRVTIDDLIEQVSDVARDGEPVLQDPVMRDQLVRLVMEKRRLPLATSAPIAPSPRIIRTRYSCPTSCAVPRWPAACASLRSTCRCRRRAVRGRHGCAPGGFWQRAFQQFLRDHRRRHQPGAGNIVAEHILGLPK